MNIQEQIIALLNGDLREQAQVEELMHVLAVSPEKRTLFVEQVQLSRTVATVAGSIAPSCHADERIWQGIHAIDAGMMPPGAPGSAISNAAPVRGTLIRRFWRQGIAALVLIAAGLGAGYLLRAPDREFGGIANRAAAISQMASPSAAAGWLDRSVVEVVRLRDSLRLVTMEIGTLRADRDLVAAQLRRARKTIAGLAATVRELPEIRMLKRAGLPLADGAASRLRNADGRVSPAESAGRSGVISDRSSLANAVEKKIPAASSGDPMSTVRLRDAQYLPPAITSSERFPSSYGEPFPVSATTMASGEEVGPWRFGVNNIFRLSLPRVYGLPEKSTIATDRELDLSYRFSSAIGGGALRMGVAAGQTPFGQIFYKSSDGSSRVDTIIEQRPALFYGRGYVAPELFRSGIIIGSLELGAGGTRIGPMLTVGSNLEAASDASFGPFDGITTHIGLSSWILWSQTGGRTYTSTNLNVQIGAALRF